MSPKSWKGEGKRRGLHIAVGLGAFLLKVLPWPGALGLGMAGILFNALILPRVAPRVVRPGRGGRTGLIAYPVTVFLLILCLPIWAAAAGWAALAWGDGLAGLGHARSWLGTLPWNPRKSWGGFLLCALGGGYGALLLAWWTAPDRPLHWLWLPLAAGVSAALAESADLTLDDNVRTGLAAGAAVWILGISVAPLTAAASGFWAGLLVSSLFGLLAWRLGTITGDGALTGAGLGTLIWTLGSWKSFVLLGLFFVLGTLATKTGYAVKRARGLAQEAKGRRSSRHVLANGLVPCACALLMTTTNEPESWLNLSPAMAALALGGALAAATADTLGSEIGQLFKGRVWIFATLHRGVRGSQGGVSLPGSLATFLGSALIGLAVVTLRFFPHVEGRDAWLGAAVVGASGVFGAYVDSFLGGWLEDKGYMGNEEVNLACTLSGAIFGPVLVKFL